MITSEETSRRSHLEHTGEVDARRFLHATLVVGFLFQVVQVLQQQITDAVRRLVF